MKITNVAYALICIVLLSIPIDVYSFVPRVTLIDDTLSLEVKDTPLAEILEMLAEQGVIIHADPNINPSITASFTRHPIEKAFSRILGGQSYTLLWNRVAGPADAKTMKLAEIRIFEQGHHHLALPVQPGGDNLDIAQGKDGVFFVKNTILVRIDPALPEETLKRVLDAIGATIVDRNEALGVTRLQIPEGTDVEAVASVLSDSSGIEAAEPDYAYPLEHGEQVTIHPQSLSRETNAPVTPTGSTVAVLDSGLAESFAGSPFIKGSYDAVTPAAAISDHVGHGTQMSLIASGVVDPVGGSDGRKENTPVLSIRAFDENGFTSNSILMDSINYAIDNGARVLSMSWGSETKSELLESAIDYAATEGLVLVAAAGNTPSGVPVYPAAYDKVIGVGALMPDGNVWEDSNYGDFVSVYAPGLADLPVGHNGEPGTYAGTSIAAAYTAKEIAAILAEHPDADIDDIMRMLAGDEAQPPVR